MIRILFFLGLVSCGVLLSTCYHFFGFQLWIVNKSSRIDVTSVACKSELGEEWAFNGVKKGNSDSHALVLGNGDVLTCLINFDKVKLSSIA